MQHISEGPNVSFLILVKLAIAGTHLKVVSFSTFDAFDVLNLSTAAAQWWDRAIIRIHFLTVLLY